MRASLGLLLLAGALSAQAVPRVPLRPGVDTNDARSYYGEGLSSLRDDPVRADRAFYWATRIDPALAEAWYGRWVAKVLSLPALSLVNYVGGTRVWAHDSAFGSSIRLDSCHLDENLVAVHSRADCVRRNENVPGNSRCRLPGTCARAR